VVAKLLYVIVGALPMLLVYTTLPAIEKEIHVQVGHLY